MMRGPALLKGGMALGGWGSAKPVSSFSKDKEKRILGGAEPSAWNVHRGARIVLRRFFGAVSSAVTWRGLCWAPKGLGVVVVKLWGCPLPLSWLKVVMNLLVIDFSSLFAREMQWMPSVTLRMAL